MIATLAGCGGGGPLPDKPPTVSAMIGADKAPLIVDWPAGPRGDLEAATKQAVAVVAVGAGKVDLLHDCRVPGSYAFLGISKKEQLIRFEDAGDVSLNLPLRGAALVGNLQGELGTSTALDVALVTVGKRRTTRMSAVRSLLVGSECARATHFVRGFDVGAFVLATSEKAKGSTVASLFGAKGAYARATGKAIREVDGNIESCSTSAAGGAAPPGDCSAVLRLDLKAIDEDANVESASCSEGLVRAVDGRCVAKKAAASFECAPGSEAECKAQCAQGNAASCGHYAHLLRRSTSKAPDFAEIAKVAQQGCEAGSERACVVIGELHQYGNGMPVDYAKAAAVYQKACDAGSAGGCSRLGVLYDRRPGLAEDPKRAGDLYDRACRGGEPDGCNNLGALVLRGRGTKAAPEKAREIYEDACKNGSKVACGNLGDLLAAGVGGPKDVVRAGELLAQGCEASGTHCVRLGDALSGSGALPKDALRSVESYQKGTRLLASQCNLGIADRCDDLGWLFHDGKAMPRDDAQALSYIRKGCTLGSPVGCNHLGLYLERGWGAEPNRAEAKKHYGTACESGVAEGCVSLGMLSSESERGSLMARACTAGSDLGCFESMRAARRDGKDDVARRGLEESCDRGFGRACSYLARWNKRDRVRDAKPWTQKLDEGCTKGDLGGCVTLAEVFDAGRAQQPDSESAKRIEPLARRACDGGEGRGCRLLSILAREGKAKQVSSGEASALLQKACDHGSQRSCIDIGKAVTATEPAKAASLFQRACEATDEPAPVMIVTLIRSIIEKEPPREPSVAAATGNGGARIGNSGSLAGLGSTGGTQGAGGVAMNSSGSIATDLARLGRKMTLTARAADALDADEPQTRDQQIGCGPLGELHEKGLGFVADKTRASGYYAQACTNEDGHACSRLAATYFDVKKQPTQAVFVQVLNKHACNLGDGDGCLEVAKLQASSKDRDERDEAPTTFDRACDLGSAEGCYRAGSGTLSRPDDETLEHFTQGCKLADARSCVAAAKLEERGFPDHPADKSAAKKLRAEACRLGEKSACK